MNPFVEYIQRSDYSERPKTELLLPRFTSIQEAYFPEETDRDELIRWFLEMRNLAERLIDRASNDELDKLIDQDWFG